MRTIICVGSLLLLLSVPAEFLLTKLFSFRSLGSPFSFWEMYGPTESLPQRPKIEDPPPFPDFLLSLCHFVSLTR